MPPSESPQHLTNSSAELRTAPVVQLTSNEFPGRSEQFVLPLPVRGGIPFPKGLLPANTRSVRIACPGGSYEPAGVEAVSHWPDGSIRWGLVDFLADRFDPATRYELQPSETVDEASFGTATVAVRPGEGGFALTRRWLSPDLTAESRSGWHLTAILDSGRSLIFRCRAEPEQPGSPLRRRIRTEFQCCEYPDLAAVVTFEFPGDSPWLLASIRIRNSRRASHQGGLWDLGDSGSLKFRRLSLTCELYDSHEEHARFLQPESDVGIRRAAGNESLTVTQYSSGGTHWNSSNHSVPGNPRPLKQRGYLVTGCDGRLRGYRATPVAGMTTEDRTVAVGIPEFWQNFPLSLEASPHALHVHFCPAESSVPMELQGGEQKTYHLCILDHPEALDPEKAVTAVRQSLSGLRLRPAAETLIEAAALPWMTTLATDDDRSEVATSRFLGYLREATSGAFSIPARRERIDEYGWRNFGDIHADHEQTHFTGDQTIISHYNNQFDLVYGGLILDMILGGESWWTLADPMARHVSDIDIYHTNQDRSEFSGGLFWHTDHYLDAATATHRTYSAANVGPEGGYGGGPSCEHNYTTGLLLHYYRTGSPQSRDSVISLADWVLSMEDGSQTIFGLLDAAPTGAATHTVFTDFHGPGRGAGNSVNALLDAWLLTGSDKYYDAMHGLLQRCIHPAQDCEALHLIDAEGHWSYTVFLTAAGRVLQALDELDRRNDLYTYLRDSLATYGEWMARRERPTLSEPEKLEYPTEAWAAQDLRKANALRLCAACTDDEESRKRMRSKATEISEAAWADLYRFGTAHCTARCLSILMTEGFRDIYHRRVAQTCSPAEDEKAHRERRTREWAMFIGQKERVRGMLKQPAAWPLVAVRLANPFAWLRTVQALKRRFFR